MIVRSQRPVLLIGAGPIDQMTFENLLSRDADVVAVDGGANWACERGIEPVRVIGDLDSLEPPARVRFADRLVQVAEQETTDFDKALRHVDAPVVIGMGFSGGRLDHELAALSVLTYYPERMCVLIGPESLTVLCPPDLSIDLPHGTVVSIYPMTAVRVRSEGLRWPTDHLLLEPTGRIGTSNTVAGPVRLCAETPGALLILPLEALDALLTALPSAARWPARAG